ncbi:ABC transporter substrate-binding protein [Rhodococcus sp. NPDC058521]|uniref:ABC transporter substrate-binding protein n=1 Tax=Rhodococcus sp. NPDC058521 TaxID=3346536 RepID=UPI00364A9DCF
MAVGVVTTALVAGTLASCSSEGEQIPSIGYAIDNTITTYNAGTVDGAASGARQAFGRVLPGFTFTGPEGGAVADTDIGSAAPVPGDSLTIAYTINQASVYSDGVPVTCDDLVLAWAAHSGRFTGADGQLFQAASTAGYSDIQSIDCRPGAKDARVVFEPGRAFSDWRSLFGATALMPAHVVQTATGANIVDSVQNSDEDAMARIAEFWNTGWDLAPGDVDPTKFPASGPYKIESYTEDDGLVLVENDQWWGNRPATSRIVIWPKSDELPSRVDDGDVQVIDVAAGSVDGLNLEGFEEVETASRNLEQFVLSTEGEFGSAAARRAFAACLPREQLASEFGTTKDPEAGAVGVDGTVDTRFTAPDTLIYPQVAAAAGGRFRQPDAGAVKSALAEADATNLTVRVGYLGPDAYRAAIVSAAAAACEPMGITVEDAGSPDFRPSALRDGQVDAVLGGTASVQGAGGTAAPTTAAYALRAGNGSNFGRYDNGRINQIVDQLAIDPSTGTQLSLSTEAENILWNEVPTVPLFEQVRINAFDKGMSVVQANGTRSGAGWNMDRWVLRG